MACPANPLDCVAPLVASSGGSVSAGLTSFAVGMQQAAGTVLHDTLTWWLTVPTVNVGVSLIGGAPNAAGADATVVFVRDVLAFAAGSVAVIGVMWAGIRMIITHKAEPALDVLTGLLRLVTVLAIGAFGTQVLLAMGDSFSTWVVGSAASGAPDKLAGLAGMSSITNPVMVLFLSLALFLAATLQGLLMLLRQVAIIVLVGALPLAAAGSFIPATKNWFPKVSGWLLALIFYKPIAALILTVGFTFINSDGSLRDVISGVVMLALAVVALPKLMQFFAWAVPVAVTGVSNAGGLLGALGGNRGATAGVGVAGGTSATAHAALLEAALGPSAAPAGASATARSTEIGDARRIPVASRPMTRSGRRGSATAVGTRETGGEGPAVPPAVNGDGPPGPGPGSGPDPGSGPA